MRNRLSYRAWMAILLGALVGLIPLRFVLLNALPRETADEKRLWLLAASALLVIAVGLPSGERVNPVAARLRQ